MNLFITKLFTIFMILSFTIISCKKINNFNYPYVTLNNGQKMPQMGLGTWRIPKNLCYRQIIAAFEEGYRMFDCASVYGNEKEIGKAFNEVFSKPEVYGIRRQDVWITSKLWNTHHNPNVVEQALRNSLKDLQLDYVNLYLIHFPVAFNFTGIPIKEPSPTKPDGTIQYLPIPIHDTWRAMESIHQKGLAKSIGISNFGNQAVRDLLTYAHIKPAVNQFEGHPYFTREALLKGTNDVDIQVECYAPLGGAAEPKNVNPLFDTVISGIAKSHNKTNAQVLIKFGIQRGTVVIPKTQQLDHLKENINTIKIDWKLSDEEMKILSALNWNKRLNDPSVYWKWDIYA